jgi:hypothetical protein
MYSTCYCCQIVMKLEFYRQIVQKILISSFMKIPPVGDEVFYVERERDK